MRPTPFLILYTAQYSLNGQDYAVIHQKRAVQRRLNRLENRERCSASISAQLALPQQRSPGWGRHLGVGRRDYAEVVLELTVLGWFVLAVGAFFVGLSKTALPGIVMVTVALYAWVLPARMSTAAVLILLIFGDLFAIVAYRKYVNWKVLGALVPYVLVGLVAGALFLRFSDDALVKKAIGIILMVLIVVTLWVRYFRRAKEEQPAKRGSREREAKSALALIQRAWYGMLSGFTTMTANAGAPVTSLYFLTLRLDVLWFLGTTAWFFFVVNLIKLPFSIGIGLFTIPMVWSMLTLLPVVAIGAFFGKWLAHRMTSKTFDPIVWILTVAGAVALLI